MYYILSTSASQQACQVVSPLLPHFVSLARVAKDHSRIRLSLVETALGNDNSSRFGKLIRIHFFKSIDELADSFDILGCTKEEKDAVYRITTVR